MHLTFSEWGQINKYLDVLEAEEKIESVQMERSVFYQKKEK